MNSIESKSVINSAGAWQICMLFMLTAVIFMVPDLALANEQIGTLLCNVVNFFTGRIGKAIATLAIIVVGVGALMGKVSWGMAIIVGLGVAVIFGAASIVNEISAGVDNGASGQSCTGLGIRP